LVPYFWTRWTVEKSNTKKGVKQSRTRKARTRKKEKECGKEKKLRSALTTFAWTHFATKDGNQGAGKEKFWKDSCD